MLLIRMAEIWGEGGLSVPGKPLPKIPFNPESFERETEVISVHLWDREWESWPFSTVCRLVDSSWSSSRCYSCSHSVFRLLKGKLEKRSGHLLTTYSSCLLLWFMERTNKLGKDCEITRFEKYAWVGVENMGVPVKVSYNIALLRRQGQGLPPEGSFLQRAASSRGILKSLMEVRPSTLLNYLCFWALPCKSK